MAECRICLDGLESGSGRLISPCRCSGSQQYIHENCLQRWRDEDLNFATRDRCEICGTNFQITRTYIKETYIIRLYYGPWISLFICYFTSSCLFAVSLSHYDSYHNYITIHSIIPSGLRSRLLSLIHSGHFFELEYYAGLSSCLIISAYLLSSATITTYKIRRRCRYWKSFFPYFVLYSAISYSFIPFLYCVLLFGYFNVGFGLLISTILVPLPTMNRMHKSHNNIIMQMNLEDNHEHIISLEEPLSIDTTVE